MDDLPQKANCLAGIVFTVPHPVVKYYMPPPYLGSSISGGMVETSKYAHVRLRGDFQRSPT